MVTRLSRHKLGLTWPSSEKDLQTGQVVEVFGLSSEKGQLLNGLQGRLRSFQATGRWEVVLDDEVLSLKAANLRPVEVRMASDAESGFVCVSSAAAAARALERDERRLEFSGISSPKELDACIDFVEQCMGDSELPLSGLSFADCRLTPQNASRISAVLKPGKLGAFGVSKTGGLPADSWKELFASLPQEITWLDFGDNQLTDEMLAPLLEQLPGRDSLDKLYLDGNQIKELPRLLQALQETGVTNLDLGDNKIDDSGAELISYFLAQSTLLVLVLGSNAISSSGGKAIFQALEGTSINVLYLDNTSVDDEALECLGPVLADSEIMELHLDSTKISDAGVQALVPFVECSSLNYVDISDNGVTDETAELLEEALAKAENKDATILKKDPPGSK